MNYARSIAQCLNNLVHVAVLHCVSPHVHFYIKHPSSTTRHGLFFITCLHTLNNLSRLQLIINLRIVSPAPDFFFFYFAWFFVFCVACISFLLIAFATSSTVYPTLIIIFLLCFNVSYNNFLCFLLSLKQFFFNYKNATNVSIHHRHHHIMNSYLTICIDHVNICDAGWRRLRVWCIDSAKNNSAGRVQEQQMARWINCCGLTTTISSQKRKKSKLRTMQSSNLNLIGVFQAFHLSSHMLGKKGRDECKGVCCGLRHSALICFWISFCVCLIFGLFSGEQINFKPKGALNYHRIIFTHQRNLGRIKNLAFSLAHQSQTHFILRFTLRPIKSWGPPRMSEFLA